MTPWILTGDVLPYGTVSMTLLVFVFPSLILPLEPRERRCKKASHSQASQIIYYWSSRHHGEVRRTENGGKKNEGKVIFMEFFSKAVYILKKRICFNKQVRVGGQWTRAGSRNEDRRLYSAGSLNNTLPASCLSCHRQKLLHVIVYQMWPQVFQSVQLQEVSREACGQAKTKLGLKNVCRLLY